MTPALHDAIEELYKAFGSYPLRNYTEPCPHCHHDPEVERRLRLKPLRELTHEDLRDYAEDCLFVWGDIQDFKHFLPRMLELIVYAERDDIMFTDSEALFDKLAYGEWVSWPPAERGSIQHFFHALWDEVIDTDPAKLPWNGAYGWLLSIAMAEEDMSPYLNRWMNSESATALRNLALALSENDMMRAEPPKGYLAERAEQWRQIRDWVRQPVICQKLEAAFKSSGDEARSAEFSAALARLQ